MAEIQKKEIKEIDLSVLFQKLYSHRKKLYKAAGIGILAGLVVGFSLPKTYQVDVSLSPESGVNGTSGLSGIASMFGLGNGSSGFGEDALTFNMFPEIVKTNPFALEMLQIPIRTQKEKQILLYDYLDTEKKPWWSYIAPEWCCHCLKTKKPIPCGPSIRFISHPLKADTLSD